jgi:hypothetical protein
MAEDSVDGKPSIFLFQSLLSKSELSSIGVCGRLLVIWPGRSLVVPNMVVFHDDIGAFVSVFGQFSAMNWPNSLLLNL